MKYLLLAALITFAAGQTGGLKCGTKTPEQLVDVSLEHSINHASKVFNMERRKLTDERRTDTYFTSAVTIPVWFHAVGMETDLCAQCSEDPESCRGNYLEHFLNLDAAEGQLAHLNEAYEPTGLQFSWGGYDLTCNDGYFRFGCGEGQQTTSDRMKEALHQDTSRYINLYYADCQTWGLFGFATFPPGMEGKQEGHPHDGVVNGYRTTAGGDVCGDYPCEGDTAVHELGHFLGLYHTFEGGCEGGDMVSDTPFIAEANYGCPTDGLDSCPGQAGDDHYWNFMDYADDHCMTSFSNEQGWRMLWACAVYRPQLTSHALSDTPENMSCLQGTYMNYDVGICEACAEGTYYGGPDEGCVTCPDNSTSNTIGNIESSDCYDTTTSCSAHTDCPDDEYCASSGICYINSECCHYDDAIDSLCPNDNECCSDTDDNIFDAWEQPCVAYTASVCGDSDNREFQAAVLCCVCGGGTDYVAPTYTEDEMATCEWRCGTYVNAEGCQCDDACEQHGDCCQDYDSWCATTSTESESSTEEGSEESSYEDTTTVDPDYFWTDDYEEQTSEEQLSCLNDCGKYLKSWPCQCDPHCMKAGDCCEDYSDVCDTTSPPETTDEPCPTCPVCTTQEADEVYTGFTSSVEDTACDNPGTWTFNTVASHANLDGVLGDGELCADDNQYVYRLDGQTYPTCVLFADEGQPCVDDLVCTTGTGVAGFVGGQASYVADAISRRNDHKHMDCPTIQADCTKLPTYWRNTFADKGVATSDLDNICVSEDLLGELCYVQESGFQKMCVGFSTSAQSACPVDPSTDDYLCGGISAGTHVFGWPGSIANMAAQAASAADKKHPQCRF